MLFPDMSAILLLIVTYHFTFRFTSYLFQFIMGNKKA